jgi:signal transduction histidine kinase
MSGGAMTPGSRTRWRWSWSWIGAGVVAICRGLGFFILMLAGTGPLLALFLALVLVVEVLRALTSRSLVGHRLQGPDLTRLGLLPVLVVGCSLLGTRWLTGRTRRLSGRWCGVPIASPYRPLPALGSGELSWWQQLERRLGWLASDPATWRDLLWLAVDAGGGWLLAAGPALLVGYGLTCIAVPALRLTIAPDSPLGTILATGPGAVPLGIAFVAAGLWAAPRLLHAYGALARTMLAPTRRHELTSQVLHLSQTRSESIDTGAAEMRRIERDLHDGAQARLVAMGMALDAAGQLIDDNPVAARALLAEARESSAKALAELRDLVRGIHPPVLADRGLTDALAAMALDAPLRVRLIGQLAGRPPAPVESAAYFAVSELIANVAKHAVASGVWIEIGHEHQMLRITVGDDGVGGADPARGSGLAGIERRLAAFDGVLAVSSPPGGPTVANLEIPCALSLPKTSSC